LYRDVVFDLVVEKAPFLIGLKTLEEAISSFLAVCFVSNMEYPKVWYLYNKFFGNSICNFLNVTSIRFYASCAVLD
jgi:hypothetical protein